jgi:hypothetical protein
MLLFNYKIALQICFKCAICHFVIPWPNSIGRLSFAVRAGGLSVTNDGVLNMKNWMASFWVAFFALTAAPWASANEFATLRTEMTAARESLVTMLTNKDKRGADQQKVVKDTADAASARLAKMKAPAGKEAQFKELVDNWNAFKKTREDELVPAILAGKDAEARKIAGGVQKDRYTKCQEMLSALGG